MTPEERRRAVETFDIAALGRAQTRGEDISPPQEPVDYDPVAGMAMGGGFDEPPAMPPLATLAMLGSVIAGPIH